MAMMDQFAPWRAPKNCIKKARFWLILSKVMRVWRQRKHPHIGSLSPRLARDAGLDQTDLAKHQHQWPSETHQHPRL